jgi:uncharacterized protein
VIAYLDTSAIVPLVVEEPGTASARAVWDGATRVASVTIGYAEARAAIVKARRLRRLDSARASEAVERLDDLYLQIDLVEVDVDLVRKAAALVDEHDLRGYDAVHLAAAQELVDVDLVVAAGDRALLRAAHEVGLAVAPVG